MLQKIRSLNGILALVTALFCFGFVFGNDPDPVEEALYKNLRKYEMASVMLYEHAAELKNLSFRPLADWRTHQWELEQARNALNEMGELVPAIQKQSSKIDWMEQTVDQIAAKTKAIAEELDSAIDMVSEEKNSTALVLSDKYAKQISSIERLSEDISETVEYLQKRYDFEMEKKYPMSS